MEREYGLRLTWICIAALAIFGFFGLLLNASESGLRFAVLKKQQRDTKNDFDILADGLKKYAADHSGRLPSMASSEAVEKALSPFYVNFPDAFTRLGDGEHYLPNPAIGKKVLKELPPTMIVFAEPAPKPLDKAGKVVSRTRAVLHADGTVVRLTLDEWQSQGWE